MPYVEQLQVKPIWSSGKFHTAIEPTFALLLEDHCSIPRDAKLYLFCPLLSLSASSRHTINSPDEVAQATSVISDYDIWTTSTLVSCCVHKVRQVFCTTTLNLILVKVSPPIRHVLVHLIPRFANTNTCQKLWKNCAVVSQVARLLRNAFDLAMHSQNRLLSGIPSAIPVRLFLKLKLQMRTSSISIDNSVMKFAPMLEGKERP